MAGRVYVGEQRVEKPGQLLDEERELTVRETERYVSRGGRKLEGALDDLGVDVTGWVAVDIGASTGGFTDCLLQRGARRVYAVDVGHGQLAQRLRDDPRVDNREGVNARYLEQSAFDEAVDAVVVDASFIGLGKLLPAIRRVLPPGGQLLAMVKPQFEVGKEVARRHRGVIRDPELRRAAIEKVASELSRAGFELRQGCDCRLAGPRGNVEHFLHGLRLPDVTA